MKYEYRARVVKVHDGDTVVLDVDLGFRTWIRDMAIRIFGINAPELSTPEGKAAAAFAATLAPVGMEVTLFSQKDRADKYGGRWLGDLGLAALVQGEAPRMFSELMVVTGHAKPWDGKGTKPV